MRGEIAWLIRADMSFSFQLHFVYECFLRHHHLRDYGKQPPLEIGASSRKEWYASNMCLIGQNTTATKVETANLVTVWLLSNNATVLEGPLHEELSASVFRRPIIGYTTMQLRNSSRGRHVTTSLTRNVDLAIGLLKGNTNLTKGRSFSTIAFLSSCVTHAIISVLGGAF